MPLESSLKVLFEIPGMYEKIKNYMTILYAEKEIVSNCIQIKLWQNKYFDDFNSEKVYPLDVYYDDLTTARNALGSHANKSKIGGVYVLLPFLPLRIIGKLSYIFLSTVFYFKDRTLAGNIFTFKDLLEDLDDVSLNGQEKTIKFRLLTVLGDNVALIRCSGFTESFKATNFCRISHADSYMTAEVKGLLRNKENYKKDLEATRTGLNSASRGIKEDCIFNCVYKFHIIENRSIDIMNDILSNFIVIDKFFTLEELNE